MSLDHLDQTHPVARPQAPNVGHLVDDQGRIGDVGQPGHPHPVVEVVPEGFGHFQSKAGLAGPTHSGQGDQPVRLEQRVHFLEVGTPTDERGELGREVDPFDRLCAQRLGCIGQIGVDQLKQSFRALQVPEGMDAPIQQLHGGLD